MSATGTYLDAPDDTVLRVAAGPTSPGELATRLRTLLEDDELRARMGAAAKAHIETQRISETTAQGYEQAIEATLALVGDPAHKAMAIWGKALADMGVTEGDLAAGTGVEYARRSRPSAERHRNATGNDDLVARLNCTALTSAFRRATPALRRHHEPVQEPDPSPRST